MQFRSVREKKSQILSSKRGLSDGGRRRRTEVGTSGGDVGDSSDLDAVPDADLSQRFADEPSCVHGSKSADTNGELGLGTYS